MVRYIPRVTTLFLGKRICQDPLENFIGKQRQGGPMNEDPSISDFLKNHRYCGLSMVCVRMLSDQGTKETGFATQKLNTP